MSKVKTPIEQDGYNAYGYVDGERVPVFSTSMGNCWDQDDQRAFCGHIVHCVNNHERLVDMVLALAYDYHNVTGGKHHEAAHELLAQLDAEKGGDL